ncbi:phosphomevalonate kinase [Actinoplanes subtropicus]|uniref:phosphomevalonate kinase n=1 Tax=Actinoplanes subtropicus TaxID=543632 RepID=UPI0004C2E6B0|nr:phosphomevalonate kinase [Actinoplanes subtropicus]
MTRPATASRRAPGKLFVLGEYAVLEPGHPAVLVAVDRWVEVTVSASDGADVEIESDLGRGVARLRLGDGGLYAEDGQTDVGGLRHVVSAVEVLHALLGEKGRRPAPIRVAVTSRLHTGGAKLGLGSSGAVTVATVAAVAAYLGVELAPEDRYRLAMLATARHDPMASGGDLAASVWGGWIAYQAPDRTAVVDLARHRGIAGALRAPWPGFAARRLPPPRGLALEVGWTGEPASTAALAGKLASGTWWGSPAHRDFATASDACVRTAIEALRHGDDDAVLRQIRAARKVLARLDDEVRLGIFTPRLTALCAAAESIGGAAKPSGAGGGDCGIALLDETARRELSRMRQDWHAAGVLPMPTHVSTTIGSRE